MKALISLIFATLTLFFVGDKVFAGNSPESLAETSAKKQHVTHKNPKFNYDLLGATHKMVVIISVYCDAHKSRTPTYSLATALANDDIKNTIDKLKLACEQEQL